MPRRRCRLRRGSTSGSLCRGMPTRWRRSMRWRFAMARRKRWRRSARAKAHCRPVPMSRSAQRCCRRVDVSAASSSRCWRRLGGTEAALRAGAGVAEVRVRAPRLRLVRAAPGSDAVIDAAIGCIADAIGSQGGVAAIAAQHSLANALADTSVDAVVVVGGTGTGKNDTTVRTLASMGELIVHGIGLLPGETTAFGTVGARPVLALPGRLDAALAAWHVLGRVMLARFSGSLEAPPMRTAKLTHKVSSSIGFSE